MSVDFLTKANWGKKPAHYNTKLYTATLLYLYNLWMSPNPFDLLIKLSKVASENSFLHKDVHCDDYQIGLFGMNTLLFCNKFITTWEGQEEQEHAILIIYFFYNANSSSSFAQ